MRCRSLTNFLRWREWSVQFEWRSAVPAKLRCLITNATEPSEAAGPEPGGRQESDVRGAARFGQRTSAGFCCRFQDLCAVRRRVVNQSEAHDPIPNCFRQSVD